MLPIGLEFLVQPASVTIVIFLSPFFGNTSSPLPLVQQEPPSLDKEPRDRTVPVVMAVLFCLGAVLFFQHLPLGLRSPVRLLCLGAVLWLIFMAVQTVRTWTFNWKKLAFSLILACLFYAALHLVCLVFIRLMAPRDDRIATRVITSLAEEHRMGIKAMLAGVSYEMYDREIGWVPRPGHKQDDVRISQQGLRSPREYAIPPPDPEKRILCLGDSFTFGNGVSDTETYPYQAEQIRPGTEWINLGISGTCLAQSLLHYRKSGRKFGGRYVVIGFMTDDAKRTVNCFRPFVNPYNPFTKPFAKYSNGKFSIEPNPYQDPSDYRRLLSNEGPEIERLLKIDYLTWSKQAVTRDPVLRTAQYIHESMNLDRNIDSLLNRRRPKPPVQREMADDPYGSLTWDPSEGSWKLSDSAVDPYGQAIWKPGSLGFIALTRVFDLYYNEIIADGRVPLIVIIPGPLDVMNYRRRIPKLYESLMDHLKAKRYRYFDFLDPLVAMHKDNLAIKALFFQRHFPGSINRELAGEIIKALHL